MSKSAAKSTKFLYSCSIIGSKYHWASYKNATMKHKRKLKKHQRKIQYSMLTSKSSRLYMQFWQEITLKTRMAYTASPGCASTLCEKHKQHSRMLCETLMESYLMQAQLSKEATNSFIHRVLQFECHLEWIQNMDTKALPPEHTIFNICIPAFGVTQTQRPAIPSQVITTPGLSPSQNGSQDFSRSCHELLTIFGLSFWCQLESYPTAAGWSWTANRYKADQRMQSLGLKPHTQRWAAGIWLLYDVHSTKTGRTQDRDEDVLQTRLGTCQSKWERKVSIHTSQV